MREARRRESHACGFTLLEVLVALTILALALGALIKTGGDHAALIDGLEERTQGYLVAENQLQRFRLEGLWPEAGVRKDSLEHVGRRWWWQARFETTPDPDLVRVTLEVQSREDGPVAARLTGFLARPGG
ncbi:MAG: type II secretion system minor pseudopilin GspI [Halothiobacillaceae bacterium]